MVLFSLIVLSPWPFASNEPPFESALAAGVLLLVALWAAHAVWVGALPLRVDVVSVSLVALAIITALQLVPLPEPVIGIISPTRLEWHRTLLPQEGELLPGETAAAPRATFLPISVDPSATKTLLARILGVLLVYSAARNWLASRAGFRRLAWAMTVTGVALALLALGQQFSSPPRVVYWTFQTNGGVYGPFICKNHYPDYVALCLGLSIGLLLPRGRATTNERLPADNDADTLLSPRRLVLSMAAGLMAISIAFSLSRGGMLAALIALVGGWLLSRRGYARSARWALWVPLVLTALTATGAALWFGFDPVEQRLATLTSANATAQRGPLWKDSLQLVRQFWATGTGGGTFIWVEPLVRTTRSQEDVVDHAHNEYLEAVVEGGVARLAVTLLLAVGGLMVVGRGFLSRCSRSVGPLLLGAWFGLAVGVLHSAVDFAVHMPAVALATAVVAGYAIAAATDPEYVPTRGRSAPGESHRPSTQHQVEQLASSNHRDWNLEFGVCGAVAVACLTTALAAFAALDARSREQAHRFRKAADLAYWDTQTAGHLVQRAEYLDARATLRPNDPDVLFEAAQGHIDAAVEATLATERGADRFPAIVVERHLIPALKHLRAARAANPIAPKPHTRLALFADYFTRSEAAAVHFERAKRLLPLDPDLWYASGRFFLQHGDSARAWADWQRSLELSDRHLAPILVAARERLNPSEMCDLLLPRKASVLWAATNSLFPDRVKQAAERRPFLELAIASESPTKATAGHFAAVAQAHDELDHPDEALLAWRQAAELAPTEVAIRDGLSRCLEREERYEEAIPHLEWLLHHSTGGAALQDRLDAARHGLKLKRGIEAK